VVAVTAVGIAVTAVGIAVTAVIVAVGTVVPFVAIVTAGRVVTATGAAGGGRAATAGRSTITTTITAGITGGIAARVATSIAARARVKSPRSGWGSSCPLKARLRMMPNRITHVDAYLNFQQIIPADALVVHLMICVIGIAATLVFNKSEAKRFKVNQL
jgi:hypothetical protein